jgi:hypothetical protein
MSEFLSKDFIETPYNEAYFSKKLSRVLYGGSVWTSDSKVDPI